MDLRYVDYKRSDEASLTGFEESPRGFHHHHHHHHQHHQHHRCHHDCVHLHQRALGPLSSVIFASVDVVSLPCRQLSHIVILSYFVIFSSSGQLIKVYHLVVCEKIAESTKKLVKKSHFPPFEQCACAFVGHFFVF